MFKEDFIFFLLYGYFNIFLISWIFLLIFLNWVTCYLLGYLLLNITEDTLKCTVLLENKVFVIYIRVLSSVKFLNFMSICSAMKTFIDIIQCFQSFLKVFSLQKIVIYFFYFLNGLLFVLEYKNCVQHF